MIDLNCRLQYDPMPLTGKSDMFKPWWMIATLEGDITAYYEWFLKKRTGIVLQRPAWGAHISVVRGEEPVKLDLWKKHDGEELAIKYDPNIRTNGEHWWMKIYCDELLDIREELGLPRHSAFNLHMTIGRPTPLHVESSHLYHTFFKETVG